MALPPDRITVKRRRDEEPVEALCKPSSRRRVLRAFFLLTKHCRHSAEETKAECGLETVWQRERRTQICNAFFNPLRHTGRE